MKNERDGTLLTLMGTDRFPRLECRHKYFSLLFVFIHAQSTSVTLVQRHPVSSQTLTHASRTVFVNEITLKDHSRSLAITEFNRSDMTSYK